MFIARPGKMYLTDVIFVPVNNKAASIELSIFPFGDYAALNLAIRASETP